MLSNIPFPITPYLMAILTSLGVTALALALSPLLPQSQPLLFLVAIGLNSSTGGVKSGILTAILSALSIDFFFSPPTDSWKIANPTDGMQLGLFFLVALLVSKLGETRALARRAVEQFDGCQQSGDRQQAETDLHISATRFQQLATNIPGVLYQSTIHPDGSRQFTYISSGYQQIFEADPAELLEDASRFWAMAHPEDIESLQQAVARSLATSQPFAVEYRIITPSGRIKWLHNIACRKHLENGDIVSDGVAMDITERKQAEAEIRRSKDLFEAMFEDSADAIFLVDTTTRLNLTCNRRAVELFEADSQKELTGIHGPTTLPKTPFTLEQLTMVRNGLDTHGVWHGEVEYLTCKGKTFWGSVACKLIQVADEPMILVRVTDISDRQRAAAALKQSETRLKLALEAVPTVVWEVDLETDQFLFVSSRTGQLVFGEMARTEHRATLLHPDDWESVDRIYQEALADRSTFQLEHRLRSETQPYTWQWVQVNGMVQVNQAGTPTRVVGITFDIDDHKQAELRLQRQAEADQLLALIAQTINQSVRLDHVLEVCLEQIRHFLHCDRVLVCRFTATYDIVIELEAVSQPKFSLLGRTINDPCFGSAWAEQYRQGYITARSNIQAEEIAPCYAEFLAQMQVRASLVVAILQANQIWGLLIVHECSVPHDWQPFEIDLLKQVGLQIGIASQKASLYTQLEAELAERCHAEHALSQQVQRERLLRAISQQIRQSLQLDDILATTVTEVRQLLKSDRAVIFRFNPDRSGVVIQESSQKNYPMSATMHLTAQHFPQEAYDFYLQGQAKIVPKVDCDMRADCLVEFMAQIEVQSKIVAPILHKLEDDTLIVWGLLIVHACAYHRQWRSVEVDLLQQLATQVGIAIQQADLYTQLNNQLAQKEVLLKEVHHRVKNNLQVISSMLWLQAKSAQHPTVFGALEDTRSRLQAMSLIHETLYRSTDLGQLNFHDYIQRLANSILAANSTRSNSISLVYRLQPTLLNLETAIPCGLLLNELVTNAVKHAFPSGRSGEVCITLEQLSSEVSEPSGQLLTAQEAVMVGSSSLPAAAYYTLVIQDNGIGIPEDLDLKKLKSLGLKIAYDLALQLRGNLDIDRSNGTRFQLTFAALEYRKRF